MRTELESAWRIQANLLPTVRPFFPEHAGIDAHAMIRPAREVGGDFFDALPLDKTRVCLAVGDVSGKGLPAALFMVRVVTLLRMAMLQTPDLAQVLATLNRFLCAANDECMFVTLAIMVLDTATGKVMYLNGGHNAAYFAPAGKPFEILRAPTGTLLGVNPNATFSFSELQLEPGDTVFLYTDGVPEAENPDGGFFSDCRALEALNRADAPAELPALADSLLAALATFVSTAPQSDDITLLAFRYLGAKAPSASKNATTFFSIANSRR